MTKDDPVARAVATNRMVKRTKEFFRKLIFAPELLTKDFHDKRILYDSTGHWVCELSEYASFIAQWVDRYRTIAYSSMEVQCRRMIYEVIDDLKLRPDIEWGQQFSAAVLEPVLDEILPVYVDALMVELPKLNHDFTVLIPLAGIDLQISEYDFGPLKLVGSLDSLLAPDKANPDTRFHDGSLELIKKLEAVPCLVQID